MSPLSPMELKDHKLKERMCLNFKIPLPHSFLQLCSFSSIGPREPLSRAKAAPIPCGGPSTSTGSTSTAPLVRQ